MNENRFEQIKAIFRDFDEDQWDQELKKIQVTDTELTEYEERITSTPEAQKIRALLRRIGRGG